jgi:isopenicillin-N N-acyltransferase-like protein
MKRKPASIGRSCDAPLQRRDAIKTLVLAGAAGTHILATGAPGGDATAPVIPPGDDGTHHVYDFKGTPFEIGMQHGKALKQEIVREAAGALESLAERRATSAEKALDFIVATHEPLFRDHVPMALEEIRGIARGTGLSYPHAFFAATRDGMRIPAVNAPGCTAIGCGRAVTLGGKVLVGQNKDTRSPLDRYRIMRLAYDSGRRAIVLNYPGWIANLCLTSDGVSTTGNSLFARAVSQDVAPFSLLKRLIFEKPSVQAVLDSIPKIPFENFCFLIGSSAGHLVCLENVNGKLDVRDVSDDAFGHANSILCEELKPFESGDANFRCSPVRQKNVQKHLDAKRGEVTVADLKAILADHDDYPFSICRHRDGRKDATTTASFVANLTDQEMDIAIGNPCTATFKRYSLDF